MPDIFGLNHLALLASRIEWPPRFPRLPGLLFQPDDPTMPRDQWGADEWRAYAVFLESEGARLVDRLRKSEEQGVLLRAKLTRSKSNKSRPQIRGLLDIFEPTRRGRKKMGVTEQKADEVLIVKAEMEKSSNMRITDIMALEEWYLRQGNGRHRAKSKEGSTIRNAMVRRRRASQE